MKTSIDHQIEILTAFKDGKSILACLSEEHTAVSKKWHTFNKDSVISHAFDFENVIYEIVKDPKYVPMCMEDFDDYPVVWIRGKDEKIFKLVLEIQEKGITFIFGFTPNYFSFEQLKNCNIEWSSDRKNWHPFRKVKT